MHMLAQMPTNPIQTNEMGYPHLTLKIKQRQVSHNNTLATLLPPSVGVPPHHPRLRSNIRPTRTTRPITKFIPFLIFLFLFFHTSSPSPLLRIFDIFRCTSFCTTWLAAD